METFLTTKPGRPDANRLALRVARAILDAAAPTEVTIEGTRVGITVERLPAAPWPTSGLEGLDETIDGPFPRAVRLKCSWSSGSTDLLISATWWRTKGRYRHLVCLRAGVAATNQEIVSTTVALPLQEQGAVRRADDVIAVGWNGWVPPIIVDGLLSGLTV
jgi:hypothetical protein